MIELDKLLNDPEGPRFDYVFSDLTDIPLSTVREEKEWEFLRSVLDKSLKLLKKDGQFLTHVFIKIQIQIIYCIFLINGNI